MVDVVLFECVEIVLVVCDLMLIGVMLDVECLLLCFADTDD